MQARHYTIISLPGPHERRTDHKPRQRVCPGVEAPPLTTGDHEYVARSRRGRDPRVEFYLPDRTAGFARFCMNARTERTAWISVIWGVGYGREADFTPHPYPPTLPRDTFQIWFDVTD